MPTFSIFSALRTRYSIVVSFSLSLWSGCSFWSFSCDRFEFRSGLIPGTSGLGERQRDQPRPQVTGSTKGNYRHSCPATGVLSIERGTAPIISIDRGNYRTIIERERKKLGCLRSLSVCFQKTNISKKWKTRLPRQPLHQTLATSTTHATSLDRWSTLGSHKKEQLARWPGIPVGVIASCPLAIW